ncbi:cyclic lactone autoinducer peptide [Paenibacillus sonchi]|uniref:Cyclic lactone autoinducer peptide n=1 Tax=Paenibacillus sonchi TaxID=373687 RepID=A0A974SDN2_9BACL|nr:MULTISPECIES: cyclic lactone autoinducer peptide [Paenibacillus sonchi group]MCE3202823.1 cyclic lactone autoinducer peptide [Paenibacillus sonchi]QQZ61599.1 cyclic lactone autoinducer peptide [Paenibacillus sonchi]
MKKKHLEVIAAMAQMAIRQANNTASRYWSYQPQAPEGIKSFHAGK